MAQKVERLSEIARGLIVPEGIEIRKLETIDDLLSLKHGEVFEAKMPGRYFQSNYRNSVEKLFNFDGKILYVSFGPNSWDYDFVTTLNELYVERPVSTYIYPKGLNPEHMTIKEGKLVIEPLAKKRERNRPRGYMLVDGLTYIRFENLYDNRELEEVNDFLKEFEMGVVA